MFWMTRKLVLLIVLAILLLSPVAPVQAANPGNYDPNVGHEMCPPHKECRHLGW